MPSGVTLPPTDPTDADRAKAEAKAKRKADKKVRKRNRALAREHSPHVLSRARMNQAALAAIGVGIVLILLGLLASEDFVEAVAINLGSTVLAIGLISVAYERWVREAFTRELVSLVDLKVNTHEAGLLGVHNEEDVVWSELLGSTENIWIAVRDASWVERHWAHILLDAGAVLRRVVLTVSEPDGPVAAQIAQQTNRSADEVAVALVSARRTAEQLWTTARRDGLLHAGSSLQIQYVPEVLSYEYVRTDERFVVILDRARGKRPGERSVVMIFDLEAAGPSGWWRGQVSDRDGTSTAFDEVV